MAINRISESLPTTTKVTKLNDQTLELSGRAEKAQFDKVELDQFFDDSGTIRKFKRNVVLGGTTTTFNEWFHVKAEAGYSIWRLAPAGYTHNANNQIFFDDREVTAKGLASTEQASSFDSVFVDTGTFANNTTEAASEGGTAFSLMSAPSHFLYIGATATFTGVQFRFGTKGGNYTLRADYYDGTNWVQLTAVKDALVDNTSKFLSDGTIEFTAPTDWAQTSVNSVTRFWIRLSTTTTPNVTAKANQIVPGNSVISLLALSSNEVINETWRWCSFNNSVYVTIRNDGSSTTEGDFYIKSSSSSANKESFFASNHEFTSDYQDVAYAAGGLGHRRSVGAFENISSGDLLFLGIDAKVRKASAHRSSTLPVRYMATGDITSGASGVVLSQGEYTLSTWSGAGLGWVGGQDLYVASGAGLMRQTPTVYSGSQIQYVGYAESPTKIWFDPHFGSGSGVLSITAKNYWPLTGHVSFETGAGLAIKTEVRQGVNVLTFETTGGLVTTRLTPQGGSQISGDINLNTGAGVSIAQSGQTITFGSSSVSDIAPADVAASASVGIGPDPARDTHAHRGVTSLTPDTGAVTYGAINLQTGSGISLTKTGQDIRAANTGVLSVQHLQTNQPRLFSDIILATGAGISLSQSGQTITIEGGGTASAGVNTITPQGGSGLQGNITINTGAGLAISQSGQTITLTNDGNKVYRIGHTYAIPGEIKVASGDTDFIVPFFVSLASGQVSNIVKARYRINAGTSATCRLNLNDTPTTQYTGISVTQTTAETVAQLGLHDNDKIALEVTGVSGTPKNLTFTIFVEYTQ